MTPEASQSCFWKAVEARMRTRIPPRYSLAGCASANCVLPRHQRCCRGGNQPPASVAELDQLMAAGCSFSHPHLVGRGFAASGGAGPAQDPSRCCRHALRKIKDGTLCVAGTLSDAALKVFRSRMAAFRMPHSMGHTVLRYSSALWWSSTFSARKDASSLCAVHTTCRRRIGIGLCALGNSLRSGQNAGGRLPTHPECLRLVRNRS